MTPPPAPGPRRPSTATMPLPGTRVRIPLTDRPGDEATVRVIAAPRRDMVGGGRLSSALEPFADALLVDAWIGERLVLPGAWVQTEVIQRGTAVAPVPVAAAVRDPRHERGAASVR